MKINSIMVGESFKIVDDELIKRFPSLKGKTLILSVFKKSGRMFSIQYNGEGGCMRLRVKNLPLVERVVVKNKVKTLAMLLMEFSHKDAKPTKVKLNINGRPVSMELEPAFWLQNPKNIRLRGITEYGRSMTVPGSSIVMEASAIKIVDTSNVVIKKRRPRRQRVSPASFSVMDQIIRSINKH